MLRTSWLTALFGATLSCLLASADEVPATSSRRPTQPAFGAYPLIGLAYAAPIRTSIGVGVVIGELGGCVAVGRGILVEAEAGSDGGKLGLGVAATDLLLVPSTALSLKISVFRTWGHPWRTTPGASYVGPEATFTLKYVKATIGYAWRVAGDGRSRVLVAGLGLGL